MDNKVVIYKELNENTYSDAMKELEYYLNSIKNNVKHVFLRHVIESDFESHSGKMDVCNIEDLISLKYCDIGDYVYGSIRFEKNEKECACTIYMDAEILKVSEIL